MVALILPHSTFELFFTLVPLHGAIDISFVQVYAMVPPKTNEIAPSA